jgi:hypothetical protein
MRCLQGTLLGLLVVVSTFLARVAGAPAPVRGAGPDQTQLFLPVVQQGVYQPNMPSTPTLTVRPSVTSALTNTATPTSSPTLTATTPTPTMTPTSANTATSTPTGTALTQLYADDFETDQGWEMFEEVVGGSPCYGTGLGEVVRSTDVAFQGSYSLRVWANKKLSTLSNHVSGQKKVLTAGQARRLLYQVSAYIPPDATTTGQTGPEFSMQNTRELSPAVFTTFTAGLQDVVNPYIPTVWQVWTDTGSTPGQPTWIPLVNQPPLLQPGAWYILTLEADYSTNTYVQFSIAGNGVVWSSDLSAYAIAPELKGFSEEALWLTMEAENLYSCNAPGIFDYRVYYDLLGLYQRP